MAVLIFLLLLVKSESEPIGYQASTPEEVSILPDFPDPKTFFKHYVVPAKPVIFKGAAKKFPAYRKWTDSYIQSLPQAKDYFIFLEEGKKENRGDGSRRVSFNDFLNIYKSEDVYCVNEIPPFMRGDMPVPRSIACPFLLDHLMIDNVMWFSSGGTKSVWHNDGFENINCLFRGKKTFILADRAETPDRAHIDIREGSYSTVDVDNVDLKRYPGLGEIQFYKADMDAGDCLYVPFLWFHHVSSVGSNLAANIWWRSYRTEMKCEDENMPDLTIADLKFMGADDSKFVLADRVHLAVYTDDYMYNHNHSTEDVFLQSVGQVLDDAPGYEHVSDEIILWLFSKLDKNRNGLLEYEEIDRILFDLPGLLATEHSYLGMAQGWLAHFYRYLYQTVYELIFQ